MPRVSVIIPTYNRAKFVGKAIESVLKQTATDFEVIVIDDGSTDGTRIALEKYSYKIRYIYQENAGVSAARNTGIRLAKGEWVAFLDSDDEWTSGYLSAQIAQVGNVEHAVAHITNAVTIYQDGKRIDQFGSTNLLRRFKGNAFLTYERPLSVVVKFAPWFLQSSMIRRDILAKDGLFDTELSIAEDLDVIARIALRGPITFCKDVLVQVYRRNESIQNLGAQSVTSGIYSYKAFGKVYANLLSSPEVTWAEKVTIAKALSINWRGLGNTMVMAGKKIDARQFFKKSLFYYPSVRSLVKLVATFLPQRISRALVLSGRHILPGEDTVS